MIEYIKKLTDNDFFVILGSIWGIVSCFLFPSDAVYKSTLAVIGIMVIDLITRLYALARSEKGLMNAVRNRKIRSCHFAKGTIDKLLVLGLTLVIGGFAHQLPLLEKGTSWFISTVLTVMFLRDVLSIVENLVDAGVTGLGVVKDVVQNELGTILKNVSEDKED